MSEAYRVHGYAAGRLPTKPAQRSGQVTTIKVDRALWAAALRAADGNPRRLKIISSTEVIITNGGSAA